MRIPKDIFFPLNTSKTKKGLGSSIPSPSFSLQDWLKDNKIKGQEFYIEDEISVPVFLPEDPLTTDPNVDYTKPLVGESFEAFGVKLPFKGNYSKIEELVSSAIFGNPGAPPNDVILRAVSIVGTADIALLQGLGEGVEVWAPVSIYYFEAYYITFDIIIRAEWSIQLGSNQIDSYLFDGFTNPSERHYYAEGSLLRPDGGSNQYYVIDEAGNGTEVSSPGGGTGSSQITHLLTGYYSAIELSGGIYISGSEVRIDISCWQNQFQSGDISVEVFPESGLSFPGTHNLDPANGTNSGLATIPFTSLVADTWYMVEIKLSNLAARNGVNSSDLNTDFIVTKVAFKTNSTNDGLAVTFAATCQFPYGSQMGINTYVPRFGSFISSGTGINMSYFNSPAIEIYAMNSYLNTVGGQNIFMYSVSTDTSGIDRSWYGNQLIINPVNDGGPVSLQRVIQIRLSGSFTVSGFEGCPYQNSDIYNEVYFNFSPSQLTQPINL
jgi:hypothetical protein